MYCKMLGGTVIIGLLMLALLVDGRHTGHVKQHAEDLCKSEGKDIYKMHNTEYQWWCCNCEAGYHKAADCRMGDPTDTTCKACVFDPKDSNNQTFTPTENNSSHCYKSPNESLCENSMNTDYVPGSPTKSSSCKCKDGFFPPVTTDVLKYGCNRHSVCYPGYQPADLGTPNSDTRCVKCPAGTFSNVFSATLSCMPFTLCKTGERIVQQGTSIRDVVCSGVIQSNISEHVTMNTTVTTDEDGNTRFIMAQDQQNVLVPVLACVGVLLVIGVFLFICYMRRKQNLNGRNRIKKEHAQNPNTCEDHDEHLSSLCDEDACEGGEAGKFLKKSESDEQSKRRVPIVPVVRFMKNLKQEIMPRNSESESCEITITDHEKPTIQNTTPLLAPPVDENDIEDCECRRNSVCKTAKSCSGDPCGTIDNKHSLNRVPCLPCLVAEIIRILSEKWPSDYMCALPSLRENIKNCLKDHNLGWKLFSQLEKHKISDLKPYMRQFLNDTEISDEEENHKGNAKKIKHQWCSACKKNMGQQLTPSYLLGIKYEHGVFRDDMMEVFVENFKPRNNIKNISDCQLQHKKYFGLS